MSFIRQDQHKKKKLSKTWRRPKGLQSKMRLQKKGYNTKVKPGYGTPNNGAIKGKNPVIICTVEDLKKVGKEDIAIISGTVGKRKKMQLLEEAQKANITFLNADDKTKTAIETDLKERQEKRKKVKAKKVAEEKKAKEEKKESAEKKKEEKAEEKTEDVKEEEKKEQEKALIKKGAQ